MTSIKTSIVIATVVALTASMAEAGSPFKFNRKSRTSNVSAKTRTNGFANTRRNTNTKLQSGAKHRFGNVFKTSGSGNNGKQQNQLRFGRRENVVHPGNRFANNERLVNVGQQHNQHQNHNNNHNNHGRDWKQVAGRIIAGIANAHRFDNERVVIVGNGRHHGHHGHQVLPLPCPPAIGICPPAPIAIPTPIIVDGTVQNVPTPEATTDEPALAEAENGSELTLLVDNAPETEGQAVLVVNEKPMVIKVTDWQTTAVTVKLPKLLLNADTEATLFIGDAEGRVIMTQELLIVLAK